MVDFLPCSDFKLNCSFSLHPKLFGTSAFHKDLFEYNLGISKPDFLEWYGAKVAVSNGGLPKTYGIEFFSMLRTNKDVRVEFEGPNELKRLR